MGYKISYSFNEENKINYIQIIDELSEKEIDEIVNLGEFNRIQSTNMPSIKELTLLNKKYFSKFPKTGFRIYGSQNKTIDLDNIVVLSNLEKLIIDYTDEVINVEAITKLQNITKLCLEIEKQKNFDFISNVSEKLEVLHIEGKKNIFDINYLKKFVNLKSLHIINTNKNIESISELINLEELKFTGVTLKDCSFINKLDKLQNLTVNRGATESFKDIYGNNNIKYLKLFRISNFMDVDIIKNLPNLEAVVLDQLKHINYLPNLSELIKLKHIFLDDMRSLVDLSSLEYVPNLESVCVVAVPTKFEANDILPVVKNNSVRYCRFTGTNKKKKLEIDEYVKQYNKISKWDYNLTMEYEKNSLF